MEWLDQVWAQVAQYINVPYLLIFVLIAYLVKKYLGELIQRITPFNWQTVYTVLIIATIVAIPFLLFTEISWVEILFSYTLGTTLHELIFQWIEKLFIKKPDEPR
jgi:hypothetical protein